jgi:hypothetical protein
MFIALGMSMVPALLLLSTG